VNQVLPPLRLRKESVRSTFHKLPVRLVQNKRYLLPHRQIGEAVQQLIGVNRSRRIVRRHQNDSLHLSLVSGDQFGAVGERREERRGRANEGEDGDSELDEAHFVVEIPRTWDDDGVSGAGEGEDRGVEGAVEKREESEKAVRPARKSRKTHRLQPEVIETSSSVTTGSL